MTLFPIFHTGAGCSVKWATYIVNNGILQAEQKYNVMSYITAYEAVALLQYRMYIVYIMFI